MALQTSLDAPLRTPSVEEKKTFEDPLLENLVAWYDFKGSAGDNPADLHTGDGASQNLTDNNTVQRTSSTDVSTGQAADFDGAFDYFDSTDSDLIQDTTSSIAVIIHPNNAEPGASFGVYDDPAGWLEFGIEYTESSGLPQLSLWAGGFEEDTINITDDKTWFVIARWDQSAGKTNIQARGQSDSVWRSATSTNAVNSFDGSGTEFIVGHDNSINYFEGWIDSLAYWTEYISDQDRDDYYNSGNGITYPGSLDVTESTSFGLTGSINVSTEAPVGEIIQTGETVYPITGHNVRFISDFFESSWNLSEAKFQREGSLNASVPQGVFLSTDTEGSEPNLGSRMYISDTDSGEFRSYVVPQPYNTSTAVRQDSYKYENDILGFLEGIHFKPDGTKLFACAVSLDRVVSWTLSDPWNLSSLNWDNASFDTGGQTINGPSGIFFRDDGEKMYITGVGNDNVYQYDLPTAWDHTSASFEQEFDLSNQTGVPDGLSFRDDGSRMYVADSENGRILQYNLSTDWNVNTANFDRAINTKNNNPRGLFVSRDGRWIVTSQSDTGGTEDYRLGNITTTESPSFTKAVGVSSQDEAFASEALSFSLLTSFNAINQDTLASENLSIPLTRLVGIEKEDAFGSENSSVNLRGNVAFESNFKIVENPTLTSVSVIESTEKGVTSLSATSSGVGALNVVDELGLANETSSISSTGKTNPVLTATLVGEDSKIFLTRILGIGTEDAVGSESASARAITEVVLDEVRPPVLESPSIEALYETNFVESGSSAVSSTLLEDTSVNQISTELVAVENSSLNIKFTSSQVRFNVTSWSLGVANLEEQFDLGLNNPLLDTIHIENDGNKLFVGNSVSDNIIEYYLATPYDISTAINTGSLSVSNEVNRISGVQFNDTGDKVFVSEEGDKIFEYDLSNNWDMDSGSFNTSHDFSGSLSKINSIHITSDGKELYAGNEKSLDTRIYKFNLSTAYDLSTATFDETFLINKAGVNDIYLSPNKEKMYVLEEKSPDNFSISRYDLDQPSDLSSAEFVGELKPNEDVFGTGIDFKKDGSKLYFTGQETNKTYQYKLTGDLFERPNVNSTANIINTASTGISSIQTSLTDSIGFNVVEKSFAAENIDLITIIGSISPTEIRPPVPEDILIETQFTINQVDAAFAGENASIGAAKSVFVSDIGVTTLSVPISESYKTSIIHEALASEKKRVNVTANTAQIPITTLASETPLVDVIMDSTIPEKTIGIENAQVGLTSNFNSEEDGKTVVTTSLSATGALDVFDILSFIESVSVSSKADTPTLQEVTKAVEESTSVLLAKATVSEVGRTTLTVSILDTINQNVVDVGISGESPQVSGTYLTSTPDDAIATESREIKVNASPLLDEFRPPVLEQPYIGVASSSEIGEIGLTGLSLALNPIITPNFEDNLVVSLTVGINDQVQYNLIDQTFAGEAPFITADILTEVLHQALASDPVRLNALTDTKATEITLASENPSVSLEFLNSVVDDALAIETYNNTFTLNVNLLELGKNQEIVQTNSSISITQNEETVAGEITQTVADGVIDEANEKTFANENVSFNLLTSILTDEKIIIFEEVAPFLSDSITTEEIGIGRLLPSINLLTKVSLIDQSLGRFSSETGENQLGVGRNKNEGVLGRAINDGSLIRDFNQVEKSDRTQNDVEKS